MRRLLLLAAFVPVVMADTCNDTADPCLNPAGAGGLGSVVTTVEAADDPCAGQPPVHIVAWFTQRGVRYPLRCGTRDDARGRGGYGYVHIRYDATPQDASGHGDPINDHAFAAEMQTTLDKGKEALQGGGTWRYTLEYSAIKSSCTKSWGFRVVLARSPGLVYDGLPAGIITALRYSTQPAQYP